MKTTAPDTMNQLAAVEPSAVYKKLGVDQAGLTTAAAAKRQQKYGKNLIEKSAKEPLIKTFLSNFTSVMAILLWVGGLIAIIAHMLELGIAIWLVNVINGVFSFWQEFQAGKATEALSQMLPAHARVLRDGKQSEILAEDLVPGDTIYVEEGDNISADARLIQTTNMKVDQSTLTGESAAVSKRAASVSKLNVGHAELSNMIFAGTSVSSGSATAVVLSTGMKSDFGKIARLTQSVGNVESPLEKELDRLTRQISLIAISLGVFFFIAAVFFVHYPWAQAFIFALGMIVAFIPEGLLPTVTLSLAMAVNRMAKKHALVKQLSSVETLGETSVICSDKTGTLTQNQMTVSHLWLPKEELEVTGLGYAPKGKIISKSDAQFDVTKDPDAQQLLRGAALASNARVVPPSPKNDNYIVLGDPTEACLTVVAEKAGLDLTMEAKKTPRIKELPFDSVRKRMTTIHSNGAQNLTYTKGAPNEVVALCKKMQVNGKVVPLTAEDRERIMQANDNYAKEGLRVLAIAYSDLPADQDLDAATIETVEKDLTFVGLTVMLDPPRPEVKAAVEECHRANIQIIMVTGDYGLTAKSIAQKIGIVQGDDVRVVTGQELKTMTDQELKAALSGQIIFARMAPEQKFRVVSMLQTMQKIVAVTGDGVNDAPALKKADIGIAMGVTGTDVAKEAADMILTDDNFASIVRAIEEGRTVFNNIKKFLLYILNSNMPEATPSAVFLFSRGAIPLPLTVMQILSVDLGTDMLPALGLGTEQAEAGIMDQPPRSQNEKLLNKGIIFKAFFWYGLVAAIISFGAYLYVNFAYGYGLTNLATHGVVYQEATTMTLAAIVFCQIAAAINCRTINESVFKVGIFSNHRVLFGIVFEIVLLACLIYVPFLQGVFNTAPLQLHEWVFLVIIPIPLILIEEIRKWVVRRRKARA
ncbi:cation-translocating P-type ATPase [Loigolactobacillus iwatensis]|uniref:cation-translocating P-type ATPase n=1 Tax=Loigolactobacillus iwatensis TaxID=1267156 RepID=UPI00384D53C0